jgi:two-component system osmolarity sensor histidine kinase EnvZ
MANNMRRPIDSLFGRLALLVVVVLLLSHFAGYALFRLERSQFQNRYAVEEATFLVDAVRQHVAHTPDQPLPSRVRLVDPASSAVPAVQQDDGSPLNHFLDDVRDRMPPGTQVRLGEPGKPPTLWVRQASDRDWIVVPVQPLRPPRSVDRMVLWLTIIFTFAVMAALFAAWQLQQPLRSLASAVARFGRGQPVPPVPERGPRELRQLTHGFNQMVQEVARTENDRAVMLAGVAHDLKTPLARLRLRAEMMDEAKVRDGVVRDVDSGGCQQRGRGADRPEGGSGLPAASRYARPHSVEPARQRTCVRPATGYGVYRANVVGLHAGCAGQRPGHRRAGSDEREPSVRAARPGAWRQRP